MSEAPVDSTQIENVILVISDSLRADTARDYMPYLQTLADEYATYTECYAVGPHTPCSMSGMVQSRLPVDGGYGTVLPESPPTIAEVVAAEGVSCGGWHCNPHTLAERDFHRGFDIYADLVTDSPMCDPREASDSGSETSDSGTMRHRIKRIADTFGVRGGIDLLAEYLKRFGLLTVDPRVSADTIIDAFETWLSQTDQTSRFAYLHLMDTHMPYKPPDDHWGRSEMEKISSRRAQVLYRRLKDEDHELSDQELTELRHLYEAEAEYVDYEIEQLVSLLKRQEMWDSTLLVVTSDHGELFGERTSPGGKSTDHPDYLCHELMHVPLVLAGGPVSSVTNDSLVSGVDIAPTIAAAYGASLPDDWQGVPVWESEREQVVSAVSGSPDGHVDEIYPDWLHVAVRSRDRAVLWWQNETPTEYYRRESGGERLETDQTVYQSELETARSYRGIASEIQAESDDADIDTQRLKDLGYI